MAVTLWRGNAAVDAPASSYTPLERCQMNSHAGAWELCGVGVIFCELPKSVF